MADSISRGTSRRIKKKKQALRNLKEPNLGQGSTRINTWESSGEVVRNAAEPSIRVTSRVFGTYLRPIAKAAKQAHSTRCLKVVSMTR